MDAAEKVNSLQIMSRRVFFWHEHPLCWKRAMPVSPPHAHTCSGRLPICRIAPNLCWQVSLTAKSWGNIQRVARQGLDHQRVLKNPSKLQ